MHSFKPLRAPAIAAALAASLSANPAAAATLTVDPTGAGGAYTSIQAAVDAAASGDTILIKPNPSPTGYNENVVVNTTNLTLRGDTVAPKANLTSQTCPTVVLDGCETPADPTGCYAQIININAAGVTVERLVLRHGSVRFNAGSDNATVREVCVIDGASQALGTFGSPVNSITVDRSVFQGGQSDIVYLQGNGHIVTNNWLVPTDDGIDIQGDNGRIANNTLRTCNDDCLRYSGNNGRIEGNLVIGGDGRGIEYFGDTLTITGNVIENLADDGIGVFCSNCTGGTISNNRITGGGANDNEGIWVSGAINFLIENNQISLASQAGIELGGSNSTIRNNTITRAGTEATSEACIELNESNGLSGNLIEGNWLRLCTFDGIRQVTGANTYRNNVIENSGRNGIKIENGDGTVVDANTLTGSGGQGIANLTGATNTEITNNTVSGNRTDICNEGTVATFTGNTFATGGTATACVVK